MTDVLNTDDIFILSALFTYYLQVRNQLLTEIFLYQNRWSAGGLHSVQWYYYLTDSWEYHS